MSRILILNLLLVFIALLYPAFAIWDLVINGPGPDPIADWMDGTGTGAITFLFLSLGMGPIAFLFSGRFVQQFRRTTGLLSFFYATLHGLVFFVVDHGLDPTLLQDAVLEKPFVIAGLSSYLILLVLALTSTKSWIRRLKRNWKRLHLLVYPAAGLSVLHFVWLVKSDYRGPAVWGVLFFLLLVLRIRRIKSRVILGKEE